MNHPMTKAWGREIQVHGCLDCPGFTGVRGTGHRGFGHKRLVVCKWLITNELPVADDFDENYQRPDECPAAPSTGVAVTIRFADTAPKIEGS